MNIRAVFSFFAISAAILQPALASDGWQKTKWGMTSTEVQKVFNDATIATAGETRNSCGKYAKNSLKFSYVSADRNFNGMFCFDSEEKLEGTRLEFLKSNNTFSLVADLTAKYGIPEYSHTDRDDTYESNVWRDGNTIISTLQIMTSSPERSPNKDGLASTSLSYYAAKRLGNSGL